MLSFYMKAFKLSRFELEIGEGIKLRNILHIYETTEESIKVILIEKTDPKYR